MKNVNVNRALENNLKLFPFTDHVHQDDHELVREVYHVTGAPDLIPEIVINM